MLIWGSAGETKELGFIESNHCQTCEKTRPFHLFLNYKYSHLWYIFQWVSTKKYYKLCKTCQHGFELDNKKVEAGLTKNPIPLWRRFSWVILIVLIASVLLFVSNDSKQQEENYAKFFSSPQVNDLYLADISKLETAPEHSPLYGVMKVKTLGKDHIEFYVSTYGYNKQAGVRKDISSGDAKQGSYYGQETISLPLSELKTMKESGTISGIERP